MNLLPKWNLTRTLPAHMDHESNTAVEQTYKVYKAMNTLINDYNEFVDQTNQALTEFVEKYEGDLETFTTAMRQEFQDFIDIVELRFASIKTEIIADLDIETIQANITSLQADLTTLENKVNNEIATQIEGFLNNYYTKEETESLIDEKIAEIETGGGSTDLSNYYNKEETEELITFDNPTPTTATLGGIAKGTDLSGKTSNEILDMLLFPEVSFSASLTVSPNGGTYERATSVPITSATVKITMGSKPITSVKLYLPNGTLYNEKTSNIGTNATYYFSAMTVNSSDSPQKFKAVISDGSTEKTVYSNEFNFVRPMYYGVCGNETIDYQLVTSLTKLVQTKGSKTLSYTMNQQKAIFAYPVGYGKLKLITDENGFNVTETFDTFEMGINANNDIIYQIYVLNAPATSTMKYTFSF